MNRRESLRIMTAAIAGAAIPGVAKAWEPESSFLNVHKSAETRIQRYKRYEQLVTDNNFYVLGDAYMTMLGKVIHDGLNLHTFEEKNLFSPFKCGVILMHAAVYGDVFLEHPTNIINRKDCGFILMPAKTVFRIETTKGNLVEFQQSREGPDWASLTTPVVEARKRDLIGTSIRFLPEEIVHIRPRCHKYSPYGTSALESGTPNLSLDWFDEVFYGIKDIHTRLKVDWPSPTLSEDQWIEHSMKTLASKS